MSDFETFDVAQQRAKQRAEQSACEQAGVYVESRTEVRNAQVTKDEIITMTSGILKIVDVQFKREIINDNTMRIRATIRANIDSDDINKWLEKSTQERAILVEQNEELRRAIAEQDKQITELKQQLAYVNTKQDKERMTQAFAAEDKIFLSNQKYEQAVKFYWKGDYNSAEILFTQAIVLNSNNVMAYACRGTLYYDQKFYNKAIIDLDRAIQLDPNYAQMYILLGYSYYYLNNYNLALSYFNKVIQVITNLSVDKLGKTMTLRRIMALAYYNRGITYQTLGNYSQAQADFAKAKKLGYPD